MKKVIFFILLMWLVLGRVFGQDRIDWDQIKAAPGSNYIPRSNVSGDGVWTAINAILSGANSVYGTGSPGYIAEWLNDSTLTFDATGAYQLSVGTDAQRPTGAAGLTRYNSTNGNLEYYGAAAWEYPVKSSTASGLFTAGSVLFADANGRAAQDNTNLAFDDANDRLRIATGASSTARLNLGNGGVSIGSANSSTAYSLSFGATSGTTVERFRHFINVLHNSATKNGNQFSIYLNTSGTAAGSSQPGTGNEEALRLAPDWARVPDSLYVGGGLRVGGNFYPNGNITVGQGNAFGSDPLYHFRLNVSTGATVPHWITTWHDSSSDPARIVNNQIRFYLNDNSATATGPGTGSDLAMVITPDLIGIKTQAPARTLHVAGEARITDLTTDTPTGIVGHDADGDLGAITLDASLTLSGGSLAVASPYTGWTLAGDSGTQSIASGNTATFTGGWGIVTAASATDVLTVTADSSEVATQYDITQGVLGFIDGSGAIDRIPFFSDANTLTSDASLTYDGSSTITIDDGSYSGEYSNYSIAISDAGTAYDLYADPYQIYNLWDDSGVSAMRKGSGYLSGAIGTNQLNGVSSSRYNQAGTDAPLIFGIVGASDDGVNSVGGELALRSSRTTSATTHGVTQSGDLLGRITAWGNYDQTGASMSWTGKAFTSKIEFRATETYSSTARGSKIVFSTTDNTTTTVDDRLTIDQDGSITMHATNALQLPSGTTAERPTNAAGKIRWNTSTPGLEIADGSNWNAVTTGNTLYTGNGSLSGNRTVTMAGYTIAWTSTAAASDVFSVDNNTSGTALKGSSDSGVGVNGVSNSGNGGYFLSATGIPLNVWATAGATAETMRIDHSSTGSIADFSIYERGTSGTAAAGIGLQHIYKIENSTGSVVNAAKIAFSYTDATAGSQDAKMVISLAENASFSDRMELLSDGQVTFSGAKVVLGNSGPQVLAGSGSPESVVTAPVGSLYMRTDGGAGTTLYVKESGTGNTGWIAK